LLLNKKTTVNSCNGFEQLAYLNFGYAFVIIYSMLATNPIMVNLLSNPSQYQNATGKFTAYYVNLSSIICIFECLSTTPIETEILFGRGSGKKITSSVRYRSCAAQSGISWHNLKKQWGRKAPLSTFYNR